MILGRLAQLARNAFLGRSADESAGNLSMTAHQHRRITTNVQKLQRAGLDAHHAMSVALHAEKVRAGQVTATSTRRVKIGVRREL